MNKQQLEEIRVRAEAATPGVVKVQCMWEEGSYLDVSLEDGDMQSRDVEFYEHARQDISALLAYIEELEEEIRVHIHHEVDR